jgi:hypothetical protein
MRTAPDPTKRGCRAQNPRLTMKKICPAPDIRNPNPLADLSDERRSIVEGFAAVLDGVISIANKLALARQAASVALESSPEAWLPKQQTAKAIGVSTTTLDRFVTEGAPVHHTGARRMFDVSELRAWLDARGKRATSSKPSQNVDVDSALAGASLRVVGGAK